VHAIIRFIQLLEAHPELATGYYLSFYPVCNPTGFEDGTRHSRGGKDLNREFWRNSTELEVRLLQAELQSRSFQESSRCIPTTRAMASTVLPTARR